METITKKENNLDKSQPIIKYMTFPQFFSLINKKALYFSTFEELKKLNGQPGDGDPSEGVFPQLKTWRRQLFLKEYEEYNNKISKKLDNYIKSVENCCDITKNNIYGSLYLLFEDIKKNAFNIELYSKIFHHLYKKENCTKDEIVEFWQNYLYKSNLDSINYNKLLSEKTIVSCWHKNIVESDGMWKLYSKNDGVAIITTIEKLENLIGYEYFEKKGYLKDVGEVYYYLKDYEQFYDISGEYGGNLTEKEEMSKKYSPEIIKVFVDKFLGDNGHGWFFIKRDCFKHEEEFRAIITPKLTIDSINDEHEEIKKEEQYVKVGNLNEFIDGIIVSPYAPSFYKDTIIGILKESNNENIRDLTRKVVDSEIHLSNERIKLIVNNETSLE